MSPQVSISTDSPFSWALCWPWRKWAFILSSTDLLVYCHLWFVLLTKWVVNENNIMAIVIVCGRPWMELFLWMDWTFRNNLLSSWFCSHTFTLNYSAAYVALVISKDSYRAVVSYGLPLWTTIMDYSNGPIWSILSMVRRRRYIMMVTASAVRRAVGVSIIKQRANSISGWSCLIWHQLHSPCCNLRHAELHEGVNVWL